MKRIVFPVLIFLLFPLYLFCQEFGFTRYDSKDGLPSSTVYCMTQDKEGFLWFGTETGLSRFDGTHFKNFTQEDGLPDNEVIQLFADSKGRVWISPFKKSICYYYKGKIFNQENDSILKQIHITSNVVRFAEDGNGNVLMMEPTRLHVIATNARVQTIDKIGNESIKCLSAVGPCKNGGFLVIEKNNVYQYANNRFILNDTIRFPNHHFMNASLSDKGMAWMEHTRASLLSYSRKKQYHFPVPIWHLNFAIIDEERLGSSTSSGAVIYDLNRPDSIVHFLQGIPVSGMMKDNEGNYWFTTLGQGVHRLNSAFVVNIKMNDYNILHQALSFAKDGNSILVGSNTNIFYKLNIATGKPDKKNVLPFNKMDRIKALYIYNDKIICLHNFGILSLSRDYKITGRIDEITVKNLFPYKNNLLVTTDRNILVLNPASLKITDTIWYERATTVFASNDTFYIGTLNGLYCRYPDKSVKFLGDQNAVFKNRIAAITKDSNNVVWIATFGAGIVGWKNDRIITRINKQNGLTSDICRTLFLQGGTLWVGTDKGLHKINLQHEYVVKKYTTGDGLISDIINVLYVEGNNVFVGTPEGVTFFDEQKISSESRCDLRFTNITISGQSWSPADMPVLLPHEKNNIRFDFAGISYKSAGDIRYRYRLLGLDSNWKETRETFLSYPTLPSGEYQLQLQAINKFDVYSSLVMARFTIQKLLWEETWIKLLMVFLFLMLTAVLAFLIIYRIGRREREKTAINKRIDELEQLARKAQMNPHFIFNSLNSIQQYVMDADIVGANKFISGFSRLIRQTLDFSSKPEISLAEELDYLTNYLELEKTRLENAFSWSLSVSPDLNTEEYFIPPMILQPFVENSVRHGLRYRKDRDGKVSINIKIENDLLICILEDNGVGRKTALKYKSANPIEYQSKGMSLTAERITMLNKDNAHKITMTIDDLEGENQNPLGTRVTLTFPVL